MLSSVTLGTGFVGQMSTAVEGKEDVLKDLRAGAGACVCFSLLNEKKNRRRSSADDRGPRKNKKKQKKKKKHMTSAVRL